MDQTLSSHFYKGLSDKTNFSVTSKQSNSTSDDDSQGIRLGKLFAFYESDSIFTETRLLIRFITYQIKYP